MKDIRKHYTDKAAKDWGKWRDKQVAGAFNPAPIEADKELRHGKHHGYSKTKVYKVWVNMKLRCQNPKATGYERYGGRGIKVCERWQNFLNFHEDMGEPAAGLTLDRIDVNGNYEPGNCRWVNRQTQSRNIRTYAKSQSGKTGVTKDRQYWRARVLVNGKELYLGNFKSLEEAIKARKEAEDKYYA